MPKMATATESLRPQPTLPPLKGIYAGKFRDRNPDIRAAGITSDVKNDSSATAFSEIERPQSPEATKKFHRTFRSSPGEKIIFYGMANDPQMQAAQAMTHGVAYSKSESASKLLNPQPLTFYQQRFLDRMDATNVKALRRPLGKVPNGKALGLLPKDLDTDNTTFGITVQKFGSAGELLNPDISRQQINATAVADHRTYLVSHKSLYSGEQANRGYVTANPLADKVWGKATPHDNAGSGTRKCMGWVTDELAAKSDSLVEKRLDDFRERTQFQLGKPLDPIKDTMKVGPDHTFGIMHKPDAYGVGDLLHGRAPKHFLRGEDRRRSLVAALRTQLKHLNFEKFNELKKAFEFYDSQGIGKLSDSDIRTACLKLSVPIDDSLLEQLIDFCDVDGDGFIDYNEFANFLSWRDLSVRTNSSFGRLESNPEKLTQQIDKSISSHSTTNSMYNATVGSYDSSKYRSYGCTTIRSDLPAPAVRGVADRINYGNEGDAASCLNPSIFTAHGVYELDLAKPRSKEEMKQIFSQAKFNIENSMYDAVFDKIGSDQIGIEEFRNILSALISADMS